MEEFKQLFLSREFALNCLFFKGNAGDIVIGILSWVCIVAFINLTLLAL